MVPVAILGKLYTNSLLVLMNSRRRQRVTNETNELWGDLYLSGENTHHMSNPRTGEACLSVEVNVERHVQREGITMIAFAVCSAPSFQQLNVIDDVVRRMRTWNQSQENLCNYKQIERPVTVGDRINKACKER
jgi:hypothetical protein